MKSLKTFVRFAVVAIAVCLSSGVASATVYLDFVLSNGAASAATFLFPGDGLVVVPPYSTVALGVVEHDESLGYVIDVWRGGAYAETPMNFAAGASLLAADGKRLVVYSGEMGAATAVMAKDRGAESIWLLRILTAMGLVFVVVGGFWAGAQHGRQL